MPPPRLFLAIEPLTDGDAQRLAHGLDELTAQDSELH